jgi:ABC-type multidrug transport system permease subunit
MRHRHPLLELARARLLSFVREPGALFWVFVFPALLAVALGTAFRSRPPEDFRVAVVSNAGETASVEWAEEVLSAAGRIRVTTLTPDAADAALRTREVDVVVSVVDRPGTEKGTGLTYRYDSTQPQAGAARLAADDVLQRALGRIDATPAAEEIVTAAGSRYIDFLLPGLIGLNLMGSSMWGLGFVLVMARVRKHLKRLAATPMRREHYLLSMVLARLVYLALEVGALLAFGWFVFKVSVQGSIIDLLVVAALGAASFTGLALLVGSRATAVESASGLMNFVMLPMWLLSGCFFSYSRFPEAIQPAIRMLPLTALNDALRAVMSEGAPLATTWPQLAVLLGWGAVSFLVALKIFKWQ